MSHRTAKTISAVTVILLAVFFLYPAGSIVKQAFVVPSGGWLPTISWQAILDVFRDPLTREGLQNAFIIGILSTSVGLLIALPLAMVNHRYDFVGKRFLSALLLVPLVLPPFVGAVGIKSILGMNGSINALLAGLGFFEQQGPIDWLARGRLGGIVAMNALHFFPILYINLVASFAAIDPAMEQAAESLGARPLRRFRRITLPLLLPGVFAGASIVFIGSFTELGVPLVFDYSRVASVQIFNGLKSLDQDPTPYALTTVVMAVALVVFGIAKLSFGRRTLAGSSRPALAASARPLRGWQSLLCSTYFVLICGLAILPHLGVLLLSLSGRWYGTILPEVFTTRHYQEALGDALVVPSIQNSLIYSGGATVIALIVGTAAAWVIARSNFKFRDALDGLVMLPLAIPGLVLAFGYLELSQPGRAFAFLTGPAESPIWLLMIAYAMRRLPYVVRAVAAGLQHSDAKMEEAARSLGAGPGRTWWKISIPLIAANLLAGGILAFAFAMLEVSDSLILAQKTEHFPITKAIFTLLSTLGNGTELAAALGVWAMIFLLVAVIGATALAGKRGGLFKF